MEAALRDLRYALRVLVAGRLFTLVAGLCLALGIATNATMFSVFDAMFLRPLPFRNGFGQLRFRGKMPSGGRVIRKETRTNVPAYNSPP